MGRLTFGEAIYLLFMGEIPSPGIGRLMEAMLVSFIDHGATPPSTLAARNTATTGAPLRACVAAGVLGFGRYHGGDIESCMQLPRQRASSWCARDRPTGEAAERARAEVRGGRARRLRASATASTRAIRARRDCSRWRSSSRSKADHIQMIRAVEMVMPDHPDGHGRRRPGQHRRRHRRGLRRPRHPAGDCRRAVHHLARARASRRTPRKNATGTQPMRQIDPKDHRYDGPSERRMPERRK